VTKAKLERSRRVESAVSVGEAAELRGDFATAEASYESLAEAEDPGTSAEGHFRLGVLAWKQGRFDEALAALTRARELARQSGRRDIEARAENGVGVVHYARGEYTQARASYAIALELTDDMLLRGRFLLNLGVVANIEGDLDRALEHYMRARALFRDHGDEKSEALALHNLQMLHSDRREWEDAEFAATEALRVLEKVGDRATIAAVLRDRAEVLAARGDLSGAVRQCQLAIAIFAELGDELGRGESQRWQGRFLRELSDWPAAERSLTDALAIAKHFRARLLEAETTRELAALARATGRSADARRWHKRALSLFRELGAQREIQELERMPE
jgi:tetratricopeptide (TPR) repeat protein